MLHDHLCRTQTDTIATDLVINLNAAASVVMTKDIVFSFFFGNKTR